MRDNRAKKKARRGAPGKLPQQFERVNLHAAAIDVGSSALFAAVPADRDEQAVREFGCYTGELQRLADWFEACGIETVAMESTGVYWIPVFELLESRGFDVRLVNPRHVKNVPGRKSDVLDCQWLQQLHTFGLLSGSFRPPQLVCELRAYLRQRDMLVADAARQIQHMQKALTQMNLYLHHVLSDITSMSGMRILKAILAGERDPYRLASLRDRRCKNDVRTIAQALEGHYRDEHLLALRQAVELYETYQGLIRQCERAAEDLLARFDSKLEEAHTPEPEAAPRSRAKNHSRFDPRAHLIRITGVDLTRIDGIDSLSALKLIGETGLDMTRWPTEKHFTSWLALCPGSKITGGRRISGKTRPAANRAAQAFRMAAFSLHHSHSALGGYLRRQKARLGAPKAITATAHKIARLYYRMLRYGEEYVDPGQDYYEQQYRRRVLNNLQRRAKALGYVLTPDESAPPCTAAA